MADERVDQGVEARDPCTCAALGAGQVWRQQSIIGSIFEGEIEPVGEQLVPTITGEAWVMARGELLVDSRDPFASGISQ